jgi:NAD(P)-dependent dehydrogenase (short-subunit alcohol dehydrogenase family)
MAMASVLITGTSTGIGFSTAVALARAGHQVYATMRDPARTPELAPIVATERLPIVISALDVDSDSGQECYRKYLQDRKRNRRAGE